MEDERMYEYRAATPWYREEPDPREVYPQDDRYGDPDDYPDNGLDKMWVPDAVGEGTFSIDTETGRIDFRSGCPEF